MFQCQNAIGEGGGCGKSKACHNCVIRNAVKKSYEGKKVLRQKTKILAVNKNETREVYLLVTTSPIKIFEKEQILMILEDISELTERETAEKKLRQSQDELLDKKKSLEELNTALKVLLEKRETDKAELEVNVVNNVKKMVLPYLDKLRGSTINGVQKAYLDIITNNLQEVVSPFYRNLSNDGLDLTPKEIQIADLIKQGNTTKEIATILGSSIRAIEFHRNNLRVKFGLTGKKVSLKAYLMRLR